ncbi:sensor histidine kinase [Clostridium thailandense]|uniref:sensor histidine kinase n=1 Tax=Clostridium thailandense TaxID=2794346 RepID=UPI00398955BA
MNDRFNELKTRNAALNQHLSEDSFYTSQKLYCTTGYLEKLKSGELIQEDIERDFKDDMVKFALIDNKNGKVYTNYYKAINHTERYIQQNSYCYYEADNTSTFSPLVEKDLNRVANLKAAKDFTEYYWYEKTDANTTQYIRKVVLRPIYFARAEVCFLLLWLAVVPIFIFKKVRWLKKVGKERAKNELRNSRLYFIILRLRGYIFKICNVSLYRKVTILCILTIILVIILSVEINFDKYPNIIVPGIIYILMYFLLVPYVLIKDVTYYNAILKDTEEIANGNFNLTLKKIGNKELDRLSGNINSIKKGYKKALEDHIKNERLKSELISNVSHDLKTPLTSIITYVDLLQRDKATKEEKEDYVKILDDKSKKLKVLIEDLFEVSKINSGKLDLVKEQVDIVDLIYQVVGECSSYHGEKNIEFKIRSFQNEVILYLDGKQMSRAIENLVSNALKYSLKSTRVYIDIDKQREEVLISFKNIAAYEMNFNVEDIFERFKRGDESRNSEIEGSGLGLAISKSIVELHGGKMYIEKEGDLFKVFMALKI